MAALRPNGMHHIAVTTARMKDQIEYFTDVLGAKLVGFYWMHGTEGAWHAFLELSASSTFALVFHPDVAKIPATLDVTHSRTPGHFCAPGTLQHFAFNVDSDEDLLAMRDRIRSRGIPTFGPIDHGMCKSIYFAGLEGLNLEVSTSATAIDPKVWIEKEVVELAGISPEELERYVNPPAFVATDGPVPQPPFDPSKPHMAYPPEAYKAMLTMPDAQLSAMNDSSAPPAVPAL
ncbi:VOC family protein [Sphingopyxis flava]|uniref:Catechol 2,3-dioxygenase n=1 Tax=Sphingopyxis flava TaxID=1507287 RepID=A0A1T5FGK5_9SPHN|nr:VOC family protein [Sphingopyxis flava]SKB95246.1 Catechol 2,3-dioxygenase [Sphingopyxis flava]